MKEKHRVGNIKRIRLFILPYAGGRADTSKPLADQLDDCVETIPIEYAGRGQKTAEGYINDKKAF